jgi:biotin carboxyl carrier protein
MPTDRIYAPMACTVVEVSVAGAQAVHAGQTLLVIEAMKMEHQIRAPHAGTVAALHVRAGEQVATRQPLVEVAP